MCPDALSHFHPLVARWFARRIGEPTELQRIAWPKIAAGRHVLLTAPTGSGKTLTAFLWALDELIQAPSPVERPVVLYVSPLRALNNDIQRNLLGPLAQLRELFQESGEPFHDIRVLTRSGDTPPAERRRMLRKPPQILITTPESLNLMLASAAGRSILAGLRTVILDEIHDLAGGKRGVHLISAVERLVGLCGEFQRIALSATVRPHETVARFVGGYRVEGSAARPRYRRRPVEVICSTPTRRYELAVRPLPEPGAAGREAFWSAVAIELRAIIGRNRSTLIFANSRRLCEMLTLRINQDQPRMLAYAHHGALSREMRQEVERQLKAGELAAIVATSSLELGIDIGSLDEVVLVQSAPSLSAAVQRVGRAGHQVGQVSRATILPTDPQELIEAAVLTQGILAQDIEAIRPVLCPLDVLAQIIVSMVGARTWRIDELFAQLRASDSYRHLARRQFDLVLEMLDGRYAAGRLGELRPRVSIDRLDGTVAARRGALAALYLSGGTIPDRGCFRLRHERTGATIGQLDEEFVWEASVGQTFTLGTQAWRIGRITHNDVLVLPAGRGEAGPPFWKGDENGRDFHMSQRIGQFLELANDRLDDPAFAAALELEHHLDAAAAQQLIRHLRQQRDQTGADLPHRHHLLVEYDAQGPHRGGIPQVVLHTLWGTDVNRPFAIALAVAWARRFGQRLEVFVGADCVVLQQAQELEAAELLALVRPAELDSLLRDGLEGSGFFGARFRECAGRALLLGRDRPKQRMPLWVSRLRSQKLLAGAMKCEDFPILLEAWRTCLHEEFDLAGLRAMLGELETGILRWSAVHRSLASPFARSVAWRQVNQSMYEDDEPRSAGVSTLRDDLVRQVLFEPGLRPAVARELVERFESKRQRLSPGYAPSTGRDLLDWVRERLLLPQPQWRQLESAMRRDGSDPASLVDAIAEKLVRLRPPGSAEPLVVARELARRILAGLYADDAAVGVEAWDRPGTVPLDADRSEHEDAELLCTALLGQWLTFFGPVSAQFIATTLGLEPRRLDAALEDLLDGQRIVRGLLVEGGGHADLCDAANFETLLRLGRADARARFEPLSVRWLAPFLATHQGLVRRRQGPQGLPQVLEQLLCWPAAADQWESEILPVRVENYEPAWLDAAMQETDLCWVGGAQRRVCFCFASDLDLLHDRRGGMDGPGDDQAERTPQKSADDLFADPPGPL